MAQGLFASLLIGTIVSTLGKQLGIEYLTELGGYASAVAGPAMAVSIGWALQCPPLALFSLVAVGNAANVLGGAGGPLAVLVITVIAAECGKLVSKETKIDILVTPGVTIFVGVGLAELIAPGIGAGGFKCRSADHVGDRASAAADGYHRIRISRYGSDPADFQCGYLRSSGSYRTCRRRCGSGLLRPDGGLRGHEL